MTHVPSSIGFVSALSALAIVGIAMTWMLLSPRPRVWLVRKMFDHAGFAVAKRLQRHVPLQVREQLDRVYDAADPDARLDLFQPGLDCGPTAGLPTLVWVHGGGWVAGGKGQIANYLRIVASRGFNVVGLGYSLAPARRFPTPLRQLDAALNYLTAHAPELGIDASRLALAGDSAGAQIVHQYSVAVVDKTYAASLPLNPSLEPERLRAIALFCGAFDLGQVRARGLTGRLARVLLGAYLGKKDFRSAPPYALMQFERHTPRSMPPLFISVGDADPLERQSRALADSTIALGLRVERLFFDAIPARRLGHEYQFNLDLPEGQLALERLCAFLTREAS